MFLILTILLLCFVIKYNTSTFLKYYLKTKYLECFRFPNRKENDLECEHSDEPQIF